MKKKVLCLFLGIWLCLSFSLPLYALDGTINADDNAELVTPTLEMSTVPTDAAAVAHNLDSDQTYYYHINGNILSNNNNEILSEPGWMPEENSTNMIVGYFDERTKVENTQDEPYSAIAFIGILWGITPSGFVISYGTATMISPNTALTAAHNLYNQEFGWPMAILVSPGATGAQSTPFGSASATEIAISPAYYELETAYGSNFDPPPYDWGVIRLDSNIGGNSGYLGFQSGNNAVGFTTMISGYPGDRNGYIASTNVYVTCDQYKSSGTILSDRTSSYTCSNNTQYDTRYFEYYIDATGGQSGAPLLYNNNGSYQIIGIHSGLAPDNSNTPSISYPCNAGFGLTSQVFLFLVAYKNNSL